MLENLYSTENVTLPSSMIYNVGYSASGLGQASPYGPYGVRLAKQMEMGAAKRQSSVSGSATQVRTEEVKEDNLNYFTIDFILNNITKFKNILLIRNYLSNKPKSIKRIHFIKAQGKKFKKGTLMYKLLNGSQYSIEVKNNILAEDLSLFNYSYVLENFNKYFKVQPGAGVPHPSHSYLNLVINHTKKHLSSVFNRKFKLIKNLKLDFISKNISLAPAQRSPSLRASGSLVFVDEEKKQQVAR